MVYTRFASIVFLENPNPSATVKPQGYDFVRLRQFAMASFLKVSQRQDTDDQLVGTLVHS